MAHLQLTLDETKVQDLLRGDKPMRRLLEALLNEVLQAERTEHLHAAPRERTEAGPRFSPGSCSALPFAMGLRKQARVPWAGYAQAVSRLKKTCCSLEK